MLSESTKRIASNTLYLLALQIVGYLFPLVTIPYLLRILGTDTFGLYVFAISFTTYFQIVVDYGFNLTATREVSRLRTNPTELASFSSSVFLVKAMLAFVCFFIFLGIVLLVPRFKTNIAIYLWAYGGVVGSILFPQWLFLGTERMNLITYLRVTTGIAATALTFLIIRRHDQLLYLLILNTGAAWVSGVAGLILAVKYLRMRLSFPSMKKTAQLARDGFSVFVSQISVTLFTNSNTFVLGLLTSNKEVGIYAVAEKIVRVAISTAGPPATAIYPRISALFSSSQYQALRFLKKFLLGGSVVFTVISVLLFFTSDIVVWLVSGKWSPEISLLVKIMAVLPLSVFVDNIYGTQVLLGSGHEKQFMQSIVTAGLGSVSLLFVLVPVFSARGAAISFVTSELFLLSLYMFFCRKYGLRLD